MTAVQSAGNEAELYARLDQSIQRELAFLFWNNKEDPALLKAYKELVKLRFNHAPEPMFDSLVIEHYCNIAGYSSDETMLFERMHGKARAGKSGMKELIRPNLVERIVSFFMRIAGYGEFDHACRLANQNEEYAQIMYARYQKEIKPMLAGFKNYIRKRELQGHEGRCDSLQ